MSNSNNPTLPNLPVPPASPTVQDLRSVIVDAVREVFQTEFVPRLDRIETRLDRLEGEMTDVRKELRLVGKKLDVLNDQHLHLRAEQRLLDDRVTALEAKPV